MRVLVGLSGGVDSMCAALELIRSGAEVEGAVLLMHEYTDIQGAQRVGEELGIKLNIIDCRADFDSIIKENFADEYANARTPNPCILCNERVKFAKLAEFATANGFDKIATGHYARVVSLNGKFTLAPAADTKKDQSYMLYRLPQNILAMLIFPLSAMTKNEVRAILCNAGFDMSDKPDSQEICFLPDGNYADYVESVRGKFPAGSFIGEKGEILGEHKGIIRYTVGQRKGLGISLGERAFVTDIDPVNNTVTLSREIRGKREITLTDIVFMGFAHPQGETELRAFMKVRYTAPLAEAVVRIYPDATAKVLFDAPIKAAPGQSAVAYDREGRVLLGGFISR